MSVIGDEGTPSIPDLGFRLRTKNLNLFFEHEGGPRRRHAVCSSMRRSAFPTTRDGREVPPPKVLPP